MENNYLLNIEQAILSSIIYDNKIIELLISKGLVYDDFTSLAHQEIFKIMTILSKKYVDINEINIANENANLENSLIQILSTNPITNPISYIEIIKDNKLKINTLKIAKQITNDNQEISGKELYSKLLQSINNIQIDNMFKIKSLDDVEDKKIEVCCQNYLPLVKRTANTIVAKGDTGKTFVLLTVALHYQLEQIKRQTYKKCLCWFTEDDTSIIKERRNLLIDTHFTKSDAELLRDPKYKDLLEITEELPFHFINKTFNKFEIDEKFYMLQHITRDKELIILDPLASFIGINENDNSSNKAFMDLISHWAKKDDKYIALIHHTPNDKLKGRGGEAIRDSSKVQYFLQKIKDEKGVLVERAKESLDVIVDKDNYNIFNDKPKKFRIKVFPNEN